MSTTGGLFTEIQQKLERVAGKIDDLSQETSVGGNNDVTDSASQTTPEALVESALSSATVSVSQDQTKPQVKSSQDDSVKAVTNSPKSPMGMPAVFQPPLQSAQLEKREKLPSESTLKSEKRLETREDVEKDYAENSEKLNSEEADKEKTLNENEKEELEKPENQSETAKAEIKQKYEKLRNNLKAEYKGKKKNLEKEYVQNLLKLDNKHLKLTPEERRQLQERLAQLEENENDARRGGKHYGVDNSSQGGEPIPGTEKGITHPDVYADSQEEAASVSLIKKIADLITGIFKKS